MSSVVLYFIPLDYVTDKQFAGLPVRKHKTSEKSMPLLVSKVRKARLLWVCSTMH